MEQSGFDFSAPIANVTTTSPTGESLPPIAGKTPAARHASYTGARQAVRTFGAKASEYLQVLTNGGPISDHAAAAVMHCGLSSICSIRNGLIDQGYPIVADGFDEARWGDGGTTKRTRWTLQR